MNNRLNAEEKSLLINLLNEQERGLVGMVPLLEKGVVDIGTVNKMREAIGSELADKGFNPNWEPNEYGLRIENLIERLADLYIWPRELKEMERKE